MESPGNTASNNRKMKASRLSLMRIGSLPHVVMGFRENSEVGDRDLGVKLFYWLLNQYFSSMLAVVALACRRTWNPKP